MIKNNPLSRLFPMFLATAILAPATGWASDVGSGDTLLAMETHLNPSFPSARPAPAALPRDSSEALRLLADGTAPEHNLWQRIRHGYAMDDMDTRLVQMHERWYAKHPEYVARMTDRARLYLYHIVREVERRGMPTEIALLPMIESAFNPTAYSPSNASGIWQFIPSTGKHFGMKQNWWYDGRRDVIGATNGALDYLQKLHDQFGDWALALAAYNCGEHCVERAQKRNIRLHKPTDFLSLRLPKETRNYVPKLIAISHIISRPASFGIVLADIPNQPYFAAISPSRHIDVSLAAELAGMSMEDFKALNPGNSRPVILQGEDTRILVPADKEDEFMANLEEHDKPLVSWQPYQSKKGESLTKLADRFGITLEKLRKANGLLSNANTASGQKLLVPATNDDADSEFVAFNMHMAPTLGDGHGLVYRVRRGDTLSGIAHRFHVSIAYLKSRNHGRTMIRPGQRLVIARGSHAGKRHHRSSKVAKRKHSRRTSLSSAGSAHNS